MDRSLPFGLRSAPKLFTALADAVTWALFSRGIRFLLHYLDDFLFIGPPGSQEAARARYIATAVFEELGVPIAVQKTEGPSAQVSFLGFLIDTQAFQLRLPDEKLARLRELVHEWQGRRSCTRKEMESLLGHLSHAATAVHPGCLFLHQLFALLPSAPEPYHFIWLNLSVLADISWWLFFLCEWNGVSLFPHVPLMIHAYSDPLGSFSCGVLVLDGAWFTVQWPPHWVSVDIAVKELVPVLLAALLWGPCWVGQHVLFHVDNMAVVQVVQKLNTSKPRLSHLLRCVYFYSACSSSHFLQHIPGVQNIVADALSRQKLSLFHSLFPQLPQHTVSLALVDLYLKHTPDWNSTP